MRAGARSSPLSRAQVKEIQNEIGISFDMIWVETRGDKDKATSLRGLDKTDFFTRELDEMVLRGDVDIAIHSAKDLPEPLPNGLCLAALTKGVDPRDSLVFREIKTGSLIGTSSERREEAVRLLFPDVRFTDLRGTISERLQKIERKEIDGAVIAEAALIRLQLTHLRRVILPGEPPPLQGRLAVVARSDNLAMRRLFATIHSLFGVNAPAGSHSLSGDSNGKN